MTSKTKYALIVAVFLVAITGIRLTWLYFQRTVEHPQAARGVLDLRGWELPPERTITLNGQWEFIPSRFVMPEEFMTDDEAGLPERRLIQVPGDWKEAFTDDDGAVLHYGTYRLRILLGDDKHPDYKLRIQAIRNASIIYANGRLVAESGRPADSLELQEARNVPYSVTVAPSPHDGSIELLIHVSNHAGQGGITEPIRFGTVQAVDKRTNLLIGMQLLLSVILVVHGLYAVLLYFLGAASKGLFYFSLLMVCALASVLTSDDRLLFALIPYSFEVYAKVTVLSYLGSAAFLPPMMKYLFADIGNVRGLRWFGGICAACALLALVLPSQYSLHPISPIILGLMLMAAIFLSIQILKKAEMEKEDALFLLLVCLCIAVNIAWTSLRFRVFVNMSFYPFDLMIAVFAFAAFWFKRFFRANLQMKRLAEKLRLADKRKDDFLVNTSHELRNPLHAMINISQTMLDDQARPLHEEHRRSLTLLTSIGKRLSMLLDDLLDAARLEERTIRLQLSSVHVQPVVTGVLEMLKSMLSGKSIQLSVDIDGRLPAVRADENRLVQILFNLLHNAIKYTTRGEIVIRASHAGGMAVIQVEDTGIGMDEETMRRIFLPYEQGDPEKGGAVGGFGLGLSICKELVELHGGTLQVSSSLGEGSVFTFTLPLSTEPASSDANEQAAAFPAAQAQPELSEPGADCDESGALASAAANRPRILAVDDDPVNLKVLTGILGPDRYDITVAASAPEALAKLGKASFDLVIADVMMPDISGYALTRTIRERFTVSELPVLLLTARNRSEDIVTGFQAGANDYIAKPVDALELRSRVRALTDLKRSIQERLRMEAAWLQAQIQPHFMYNTLNTIAALGTMDQAKMLDLLEQFGNYLRMSFDLHNIDRVISLRRELELIHTYLFIEKERFGERLEVQWEGELEAELMVPPLAIQTLVENAVRHGVLRRSSGGTVVIRVEIAAEEAAITVSDNGVGMTREQREQALGKPTTSGRGIGLYNTDRRLKQLYGTGLDIQSAPGQGTSITFRIPLRQAADHSLLS